MLTQRPIIALSVSLSRRRLRPEGPERGRGQRSILNDVAVSISPRDVRSERRNEARRSQQWQIFVGPFQSQLPAEYYKGRFRSQCQPGYLRSE